MTKRIFITLTCAFILVGCFTIPTFAATNPDVTVNGKFVNWTDARPYIDGNNRTMVPLRASMEACGLDVSWDGIKREAMVTDGYTVVKVPIDKRVISINGKNKNIDTNAVIKKGRTYLPIRAVAEAFGFNVCWYSKDKLVSLIKLGRTYEFYMEYNNIYAGKFIMYSNGNCYIRFYDEENTVYEYTPISMFKYNGETMVKYDDLIMAVIDGPNTRIIGNGGIIYLE
ncbi:MAG: copper amine oxidase N-terminal domain-containing protein [Lachnospiraceae bacterium]|nr:copper amine oxidase N-terminal domain-containing protein [Lachnospiraceae bacterium]